MITKIAELLATLVQVNGALAYQLAPWVAGLVVAFLSLLAGILAKRLLLKGVNALIKRSRAKWDDALLERNVFGRFSHLAPGIVIYLCANPVFAEEYLEVANLMIVAAEVYILLTGVFVVDSLLNAVGDIVIGVESSKHIPVRGVVQVFKLLLYVVGIILIVAMVLDKRPLQIVAGLGAMTAVFMLVFKDPILGLVAGIQLSGNRMLARGDWVEMPSHGADGEVLEVALTTVKIRNWDNTITTIPTYAFISGSFKNWQGMSESDGRRMKRSVMIDISTVKFCTEEMLNRYSKVQFISAYIDSKIHEVSAYNENHKVDHSELANGRRLTNIGTFRAYVEAYLKNHPMVNQDLTLIVRQLQPTATGLPIEVYAFSADKRWAEYESIMSDIFDHILAVLPSFDLKVFQYPGGADFMALAKPLAAEHQKGG